MMSMEIVKINNYSFTKPLASDNSGFSKWGIGFRGGNTFFVKEFLSPVYPVEDSVFTEKKKYERICFCKTFVEEKIRLYSAIREVADGHVITVEQFFRVGTKFYISTKAVTEPIMLISDIAQYPFVDRLRLCCSIAHAMVGIHGKKIVHADIKSDNILVVCNGGIRANIIDFDCSFFESNSPKLGEELNGDLVYLSPEGFLHIAGIESNLSCKMDVFALGLLFHQYFTGFLPSFNSEEYQYAYESVLDDHPLDVCCRESMECSWLLERMLKKKPEDRPDMNTVFISLKNILMRILNRKEPESIILDKKGESFFYPAGDL